LNKTQENNKHIMQQHMQRKL